MTRQAYGIGSGLINVFPSPIISKRNPTIADRAELGQEWINSVTGDFFKLTRIAVGQFNWTSNPTVTIPILSGGQIRIDSSQAAINAVLIDASNAAGGIDVNAGTGGITIDSGDTISIDANAASNFTVAGGGDLTLQSAGGVNIISTENMADAISLNTNTGAAETISIVNTSGTGASALKLESAAGTLDMDGAVVALNSGGAATITTGGATNITAGATSTFGITGNLNLTGTTGITSTATAGNVVNTATTGKVILNGKEDAAGAVTLRADRVGPNTSTILVSNTTSTANESINLDSTLGGVRLFAGKNALEAINLVSTADAGGTANTININNTSGTTATAVDITAGAGGIRNNAAKSVINIGGTGIINTANTGDFANSASTGKCTFFAGSADPAAISLVSADDAAGTANTIVISNTTGNTKESVNINSTAGGVKVTTAAVSDTSGLHLQQNAVTAAISVGVAPGHIAPKGSIHLRTNGTSASEVIYVNTTGTGGGWVAITA